MGRHGFFELDIPSRDDLCYQKRAEPIDVVPFWILEETLALWKSKFRSENGTSNI
jgi:hypothetical protein